MWARSPDLPLYWTMRGAVNARNQERDGRGAQERRRGTRRRGGEQSHQEGGRATREREQKPGGRQHGEARTRGSTGGSLAGIGNRAHIQGRSALKGDGCEYQVLTDQAQGGKKERKKGERGEERRGHENQRGAAQSGGHQRAHDRQTGRQTDMGEERERGERKAPPPHGREGQEGKGGTGRRTTDRQTNRRKREKEKDQEKCKNGQRPNAHKVPSIHADVKQAHKQVLG